MIGRYVYRALDAAYGLIYCGVDTFLYGLCSITGKFTDCNILPTFTVGANGDGAGFDAKDEADFLILFTFESEGAGFIPVNGECFWEGAFWWWCWRGWRRYWRFYDHSGE